MKYIVVKFEVVDGTSADDVHEALCSVIHGTQGALSQDEVLEVLGKVVDIVVEKTTTDGL